VSHLLVTHPLFGFLFLFLLLLFDAEEIAEAVEVFLHDETETLRVQTVARKIAVVGLMNMAVHGLTGVIKSGDEANTFYHDAHNLNGCCDYVMANPPFNVDKVKSESAQSAGRLPFGLPGVNKAKEIGNANYLWVSYFYSYLNEHGRAGFVMPDADLDLAVKSIIASRVINTGQVCNCCERVYVHSSIKEAFLEKLLAGFKQVKVGDPNQYTDLDMGPLIDANALKSVEEKVKKAIEQGAELLCGGHRIGTKGYFFEPTILTNCTQKMDIIQEETFGPVLPVVEFTEVEDAIAWANDCEYGLTSSIYTQNLDMAFKLIRALKFGETYVNRENFEAMQGFHAGWRKSGIGGADGKHGLEEYLQTQLVYLETKG
jgi:lactaldehyde dehydrogenase/glycolaldehyde dehydrogenase